MSDAVARVVGAVLALLAVYTAGFGVFDNSWLSGLTVVLGMTAVLLRRPEGLADAEASTAAMPWWRVIAQVAVAGVLIWLCWTWLQVMLAQEEFFIRISPFDQALAWAAILLIGYATWLALGLPMLLVYLLAAAFIVLPNQWLGAGEDWQRVADNLWYSTDGVFGRPVEVVGRTVLVFIVFGAVLQTSGAGAVLLKLAFAATGRFAGGPAHAAIVGSAMFGTMSGAAVANVVSTGVFTIPIIKRAGFPARFAGAVEAAASTGGQMMPPVMGVVAFLMADVTGIAYVNIIVAAAIPAALYYVSLFAVVLIEARKQGIRPLPAEERPRLTAMDWLQSIAFVVPLAVIVVLLSQGYTAQFAGFYALAAAFVLCMALFPKFRHPLAWWRALVSGGRTAATLMVIVAAVGFIIGVINMSGVGLQFAQGILAVSGDTLIVSLALIMLGCLVMGMGVPSAPAYLIVAIVMGPALEQLGVPTIAAHLFMLYFGVLSVVTPPVALAAFAAAPIAGSPPMATGVAALRLSIAGFIVPFLFVYHPDLLIIEGVTIGGLAWPLAAFALSTWMIGTGLSRYETRPIAVPEAGLRLAAGVAVLVPVLWVAGAGAVVAIALIVVHRVTEAAPQESAP